MPEPEPTSFMHHVQTVRSLLGLPYNLRIGQVISKGHETLGWRFEGNMIEGASRLYEELAVQSMHKSPASDNVSDTTLVAGHQVGNGDDRRLLSICYVMVTQGHLFAMTYAILNLI